MVQSSVTVLYVKTIHGVAPRLSALVIPNYENKEHRPYIAHRISRVARSSAPAQHSPSIQHNIPTKRNVTHRIINVQPCESMTAPITSPQPTLTQPRPGSSVLAVVDLRVQHRPLRRARRPSFVSDCLPHPPPTHNQTQQTQQTHTDGAHLQFSYPERTGQPCRSNKRHWCHVCFSQYVLFSTPMHDTEGRGHDHTILSAIVKGLLRLMPMEESIGWKDLNRP
jgi:hypothetical protein